MSSGILKKNQKFLWVRCLAGFSGSVAQLRFACLPLAARAARRGDYFRQDKWDICDIRDGWDADEAQSDVCFSVPIRTHPYPSAPTFKKAWVVGQVGQIGQIGQIGQVGQVGQRRVCNGQQRTITTVCIGPYPALPVAGGTRSESRLFWIGLFSFAVACLKPIYRRHALARAAQETGAMHPELSAKISGFRCCRTADRKNPRLRRSY